MAAQPMIAVVGADGFVGSGFAEGLPGRRVVYGSSRGGDIHITHAEEILRNADVIINAGGPRLRRGLTYADYQRCHEGSNSLFLPWIRRGALFIQISSAHVLGKSRKHKPGNNSTPNPAAYPSAAYAIAKYEADLAIERAAVERGFRAVFLRPTIIYAHPGDGSLPDTLCQSAARGKILSFYPRGARHHLCHRDILVEVARRIIERDDVPNLSRLVIADPCTVTSSELESMITRHLNRRARRIPIPAPLLSTLLGFAFRSRSPKYDLKTWGDIFGVFHLDTEYDPSETFRLLGIDPSQYSLDRTLEPFIYNAFHR